MSSAQSTLAAPDVSQHEAAAVGQAVEDTLLGSGSSSQPRSTQSGTDPIASSSGHVAEEVDDEEDNDGAVDVDGEEDEPSATTGSAGAAAAKKRKKKSKNKGKGKATFDKVKDAFTGKSSSSSSSGGSNNVNSKSNAGQGPPSGILKTSRSGGNNKAELSDELYERIVQQAKLNVGEAEAAKLDRASVAKMVEALNLKDVLAGKSSGIDSTGRNKKDMADYKFWSSQPVPRLGSLSNITPDGPIEKDKPLEEVRQDPYPLPKDFEWCTMDLDDPAQLKEVYELLTANYVEDEDATFRFDYSAEFIRWALQPPGFVKDWHIGVRVSASRRLVAFISGVPMNLRVRSVTKRCSEINFLCVHKKLRSKRLAPVLIKEVTRRCNAVGIFQAIYTAGVFLPTPVSACQYYHRAINTKKLVDTGFSGVPRSTTLARLITRNKVADVSSTPGLREVEERDLKQIGELLRAYLSRFDLAPVMPDEEIVHNFWSGRGTGNVDPVTGRRAGQVTWTYVVEDPDTHRITDFFSFYTLPSTAIRMNPQQTINAAYLFYYATSSCPTCSSLLPNSSSQGTSDIISWDKETAEDRKRLKQRLNALMSDALIIANSAKFDVFNALTLQDNNLFLQDQKFGPGDGFLHYYLYNYQTRPIAGGCVEPSLAAAGVRQAPRGQAGAFNPEKGSGIGVVML